MQNGLFGDHFLKIFAISVINEKLIFSNILNRRLKKCFSRRKISSMKIIYRVKSMPDKNFYANDFKAGTIWLSMLAGIIMACLIFIGLCYYVIRHRFLNRGNTGFTGLSGLNATSSKA